MSHALIERIAAILALTLFIGFMAFLVIWVQEIDLWIVIGIVVAMAIIDFWQSLRPQQKGKS